MRNILKFTTNNKIRFRKSIRYSKILNFQYLSKNQIALVNHTYLHLIFIISILKCCSHGLQKPKMWVSQLCRYQSNLLEISVLDFLNTDFSKPNDIGNRKSRRQTLK